MDNVSPDKVGGKKKRLFTWRGECELKPGMGEVRF